MVHVGERQENPKKCTNPTQTRSFVLVLLGEPIVSTVAPINFDKLTLTLLLGLHGGSTTHGFGFDMEQALDFTQGTNTHLFVHDDLPTGSRVTSGLKPSGGLLPVGG